MFKVFNYLFGNLQGCSSASVENGGPDPPEPSKKKILCLHGGGESSNSFRKQDGMQDLINALANDYEFVFIESLVSGYVWWQDPDPKDATITCAHANESFSYIKDFIQNPNNGPFEGILGFSQGAAMAIVYLICDQNLTFNRTLLFNGYPPINASDWDGYNIEPEKPLIFIGQNDFLAAESEKIKNVFADCYEVKSQVAGHNLPLRTDPTFQQVINYIETGDIN